MLSYRQISEKKGISLDFINCGIDQSGFGLLERVKFDNNSKPINDKDDPDYKIYQKFQVLGDKVKVAKTNPS